ncbi:jg10805 [Pararge aegeria aegeria]|uniref:Jg10805 protein n=1 Tax=Pararge aegeria aegeria TaxID=348720 RepID=A0A8S4RAP1_9NEOP|nr:jg10805 [Pararge aegeria aegeria]
MKRHEKPGNLSPINPATQKEEEGKTSRSSSKSEKELRVPQDKSPNDDASRRADRRLSRASESSKDTFDSTDSLHNSPKVTVANLSQLAVERQ